MRRRTIEGGRGDGRTRTRGITAFLVAGLLAACGGGSGEDAATGEAEAPLTAEQRNQADARAAVNASVRAIAAISEGDSALMRSAFAPDALVIATGPGGVDTTDVDTNVALVHANAGRFMERIWDPAIELSPEGAVVRAAYDLYLDGEFSHCGVDVFTVGPVDGEVKILRLEFTVEQPPACEMHPAGPPQVLPGG